VDLDARTSVTEASGVWRLAPRGSAMRGVEAGQVFGLVQAASGGPFPGATVSAQQGGEEVLSTRTGADGRYVLGPLAAGAYDVVVSAPGSAPGSAGRVDLPTAGSVGAPPVTLVGTVPGAVGGTVPSPTDGLRVHVYSAAGAFLAQAGVDPTTGRFALPALAPDSYRFELWRGTTRLAPHATGVVLPGGVIDVTLAP
jgi:hypothetical protein